MVQYQRGYIRHMVQYQDKKQIQNFKLDFIEFFSMFSLCQVLQSVWIKSLQELFMSKVLVYRRCPPDKNIFSL